MWLKSSPPKWGIPLEDKTLNLLPLTLNIETSKVPPPISKTNILISLLDLNLSPYAIAAAVASFNNVTSFNPANFPASIVASLWNILKWAGTVIIAFSNFVLLLKTSQ